MATTVAFKINLYLQIWALVDSNGGIDAFIAYGRLPTKLFDMV